MARSTALITRLPVAGFTGSPQPTVGLGIDGRIARRTVRVRLAVAGGGRCRRAPVTPRSARTARRRGRPRSPVAPCRWGSRRRRARRVTAHQEVLPPPGWSVQVTGAIVPLLGGPRHRSGRRARAGLARCVRDLCGARQDGIVRGRRHVAVADDQRRACPSPACLARLLEAIEPGSHGPGPGDPVCRASGHQPGTWPRTSADHHRARPDRSPAPRRSSIHTVISVPVIVPAMGRVFSPGALYVPARAPDTGSWRVMVTIAA